MKKTKTYYTYTSGEATQNLKQNYNSGNFAYQDNLGRVIYSIGKLDDGRLSVIANRAYSHDSSNGKSFNIIEYIIENDKIIY